MYVVFKISLTKNKILREKGAEMTKNLGKWRKVRKFQKFGKFFEKRPTKFFEGVKLYY